MNDMISVANQFVIYSVCYCLFILIYGYAIYNIGKFFAKLFIKGFRAIKADWKAWRANKNNQ